MMIVCRLTKCTLIAVNTWARWFPSECLKSENVKLVDDIIKFYVALVYRP